MSDQPLIARDLYIVAGSRSTGKSTFIRWCQAGNLPDNMSKELDVIANFREPVYFMELGRFAGKTHQELLVHIDIFTPFSDVLLMPSEKEISESLSLEKFLDYPNASLLQQAHNVYVFTICGQREIVFRRWLERCAGQKSRLVRTLLTQIYSDVYGDEPYQQLYAVWDQFTASLPNVKRWNVFESETEDEGYLILPVN